MSSKNVYFIKAVTNLHVGSGDVTYGVVDNMVQRDCVTNYPIINSSSLKGALRAFFECNAKDNESDKNNVPKIFGKDSNSPSQDNTQNGKGKMAFFDAKILFRPVRSNKRPYALVTCPQALSDFFEYLEISGIKEDEKEGLKQLKEKKLENKCNFEPKENEKFEEISKYEDITNLFKSEEITNLCNYLNLNDEKIIICSNEEFSNLNLPVIARNQLENGESKNLWYEEVVPRKSIFYFMTNCEEDGLSNTFNEAIKEKLVQIGGNATIGYGFCDIGIIKSKEGNNE
ncbi:CRISPR-associated protein Cmr4 [Methanococcus voltae]|uniref:type III-B CRISPR module RAMP protein Cmr4 n=1 Tax=Methanococcus voltae TaxID=2188 RepID=UPI001AE29B3A|nr:type III-B CRISPR module RAMP protein Cmr4 [Methanococcus voltae]MBP2143374.1 CRISPR-associated protein Cmr4 [Methanococcus voltae]